MLYIIEHTCSPIYVIIVRYAGLVINEYFMIRHVLMSGRNCTLQISICCIHEKCWVVNVNVYSTLILTCMTLFCFIGFLTLERRISKEV